MNTGESNAASASDFSLATSAVSLNGREHSNLCYNRHNNALLRLESQTGPAELDFSPKRPVHHSSDHEVRGQILWRSVRKTYKRVSTLTGVSDLSVNHTSSRSRHTGS